MVSSSATSVEQYLAECEPKVREDMRVLRELLNKYLPGELQEVMNWGMITWEVPFSIVPKTYNGQPLAFAALAAQKHNISVYLNSIYADSNVRARFEDEYRATGLPMNLGKSCIRFRSIDKAPLDLIAWACGAVTLEKFLELYLESRRMPAGNVKTNSSQK